MSLHYKHVVHRALVALDLRCSAQVRDIDGAMQSRQLTRLYLALNMCMEPPWPRQMPVFLPNSSAMISRAGTSLLSAWTWSLYVEQM